MAVRDPGLRDIAVGLIAVFCFATVLGLSYLRTWIDEETQMTGQFRIFAMFGKVDGLAIGDDVTVSGVPVGEVEAMYLDREFRARVTLKITDSLRLPADTSAAIHTDGLFGRKFVVLEPGGADEVLAEGDTITYTQDAVIVTELLDLVIAEGKTIRGRSADAELR